MNTHNKSRKDKKSICACYCHQSYVFKRWLKVQFRIGRIGGELFICKHCIGKLL